MSGKHRGNKNKILNGENMRFKVGNKVRVVKPYSGGNFDDGDIVTIEQIGDGDFTDECYGAISPYDNIMWFLQEDEVAPMTMGDLIRARNDHELAEMFSNLICNINEGVEYSDNPNSWLEWLQLLPDEI